MKMLATMNDIVIKELTMDSRRVKPGDLFMAIRGLTVDGRNYIENAIQNGAVAILSEFSAEQPGLNESALKKNSEIPIIAVPRLRALAGHIAARFFSDPSLTVPTIGITGTNGKTSTSHFIAQILAHCNRHCAVIGTLGTGFLGKLQATLSSTSDPMTTSDPIDIQRAIASFRDQGAKAIAIEVTSHALDQGRIEGVKFHTAIFTNLTRDHLDYHKDMALYWAAKQKLFSDYSSKFYVINLDDPYGCLLANAKKSAKAGRNLIGYTLSKSLSTFSEDLENPLESVINVRDLVLDNEGMRAVIQSPWGSGELQCSLFGRFNLSNLLAAIAACCLQGAPFFQVLEALPFIKTVPGRMMCFGGGRTHPLVVVDYAHTPDALTQVLTALRAHTHGQLSCVFGCGGDRDRGKRALMAAVAEALSDDFIMTQDNSRTEDPNQIFEDMLQGLKNSKSAKIEYSRQKAIELAIDRAKPGDIVLIAGKGHEDYQIIGTDKRYFSDQIEVQNALQREKG